MKTSKNGLRGWVGGSKRVGQWAIQRVYDDVSMRECVDDRVY